MLHKFLILGSEKGVKEARINSIFESAQKEVPSISRQNYFVQVPAEVDTALSQVAQSDLFGNPSFVVLDSIELCTASQAKKILATLKGEWNSWFVLSSPWNRLDKSSSRDIEKLFTTKEKVVCYELSERDKFTFAQNVFHSFKQRVDAKVIELFLQAVDSNTLEIQKQATSLSQFAIAEKKAIDAEFLDEFLSHSRPEDAFSLFSFVAKRNLSGALKSLSAIIAEGEVTPPALTAGLISALKRVMLVAKGMTTGSGDPWTIYPDGCSLDANSRPVRVVHPAEKQTIQAAITNYTKTELERMLGEFESLQIDLRRESDKDLIRLRIEKTLVKIISIPR